MLRRAVVGAAPADDGVVEPGMVVTVAFGDPAAGDTADDDTETFLLGSREAAETSGVAVYSPQSPLGTALVGNREGDVVEYTTPNGKRMKVTIRSAKPFTG